MFCQSSKPSMSRGVFILSCIILVILTDQSILAKQKRGVNVNVTRDLFRRAQKRPQEVFHQRVIEELEKNDRSEPDYVQYGENDYEYGGEYMSQVYSASLQNEPRSPAQSLPCVDGGPCPNSTEAAQETFQAENEQAAGQHSIDATFEDVRNETALPLQNAPCTGGNPCPSSRITREEMEKSVYDRVRNNVLKQLHMKEPPNVSSRHLDLNSPPIQRILRKHGIKDQRHLNEELVEVNDDDITTKQTVISYAKPPLIQGLTGMFFNFSEDDVTYSVKYAELWIHLKGHHGGNTNITLEFYRYQESRNNSGVLEAVRFNRKRIKAHRHGEWRRFIITSEVSRWFVNSSSNFGIDIRCPEQPDIISAVTGDKKPILEVDVEHSQLSRRRKRSAAMNCDPETEGRTCCRHNLTISFRQLGMDWVIAPDTFQSYHCYGDCNILQMTSNYRILEHQMPNAPSRSCCGPTKMAPIKLLYYDNDYNIIYSQVEDMVIQKCGCV